MVYDLIIIGGGPAGITAGIYAGRKKLKTLLLTKDFVGQAGRTAWVDNYPGLPDISGTALMGKFEEHLKKFDIEIKEEEEVKKIERNKKDNSFRLLTKKQTEFSARTIIVATGADPRPLEVEGEKEFINRGVSYCSICEAPFFKDKAVAVIGGGNAGFEAALDLVKYAKRIFIFERTDKLRADEVLQQLAEKESKIEIHLNKEIKRIEGNEKVQDIVYQDLKTGKTFQLPIDGVFIQIGSIPATGFLKGLVKFNKRDEIKIDPKTCQTSCPGLFAAGDINEGSWKQIVIAAGEGCLAALAAYQYLMKNED